MSVVGLIDWESDCVEQLLQDVFGLLNCSSDDGVMPALGKTYGEGSSDGEDS